MAAGDGLFWVPHPEAVWAPGTLTSGTTYRTDFGDVSVKPSERGQEITDADELCGVDDCCALTNISPASILHTVRVRYARGEIYTNVSNVLIAINPFKALSIYSQEYIEQYRSCEDLGSKPPHIFGLCAQAFGGLMETNDLTTAASQAILISGESGAGKTETTKLVLYHTSEMLSGQEGGIEDVLMEINPILEAFGNAKTVRNNNSSRFGKWIEVQLDPASRCLEGVQIVDYLLEVTRVTGQGLGERNYHIFYQLAADASARSSLKLEDAASANYLKANPMEIRGVDDERELQDLRKALTALDFSTSEEEGIFRAVAGIIHIGNLDFADGSQAKVATPEALGMAAELLGVQKESLSKCVCFKRITTGMDTVMSPLDRARARVARDSMAKMIYSLLFKWVVMRCNEALGKNVGSLGDSSAQFIGVLDIAGFESFETNFLEQLLINLSNEKLQNFFNGVVFTRELEEYKAEDIDIANISFADNSDVLSMLEGPGGILAMLDDATTGVRQTDESLTQKMLMEKAGHKRFLKPKKFNPLVFGVRHYAGDVFYNSTGFLEKNAQSQPPEVLELLRSSSVDVLTELVQETTGRRESTESRTTGRMGAVKKKSTVCATFKKSLADLMDKLRTANCHFVRCIKPNSDKVPDKFASEMVADQLRLCGVMETVEIRKSGYLVRQAYAEFIGRYIVTVPKDLRKQLSPEPAEADLKAIAAKVLEAAAADAALFALGKTKVFLKARLFQEMEERRRAAFVPVAKTIQAAWRGYLVREQMREVKEVHEMILKSIKESGHALRGESAAPRAANRASVLEGHLRHLDLILMQAVSLPIRLGYLQEATKVRTNMAAEATLARKLANLTMQVNIFEMEEALAQAEHYKLEGELVESVRHRLEELRLEAPLKHALLAALDSDEPEDLRKAVQDGTGRGYNELKKWLQPSGAAAMEKATARLAEVEQELARQQAHARDILADVEAHLASVELEAVQEVLARASAAQLADSAVDKLGRRCLALLEQAELQRELHALLGSQDLDVLEAAIDKIEEAISEGAEVAQPILPKLGYDLSEAKRRLVGDEEKVVATTQGANLIAQAKSALEYCTDLEQLVSFQARLEEHLAKASGRAAEAQAEALDAKVKVDHHIERLREEIDLVEQLQRAIAVDDLKRGDAEELFRRGEEGKWARGMEYWIRKDGWRTWQHFQDRREKLCKIDVALMKLKTAADAFNAEEMEDAYLSCSELGVPQSDLQDYNKISTQLQRMHAVRDLLNKWGQHEVRAANLRKQLELLEAKESGTESVILLQLSRIKNSQSLETMRQHLRKADRAELRDPVVDEIRRRADEIEWQEPFVQLLRDAVWTRRRTEIAKAIEEFEAAQADRHEGGDSPGPEDFACADLGHMYASAKQCLEELDKLSLIENEFLMPLSSTDVGELQEAFRDAEHRKLSADLVKLLSDRLALVQTQRGAIEQMRSHVYSQSGGKEAVQDLFEMLIREGLDSPGKWAVDDGPRTFEQFKAYVQEVEIDTAKRSDKDTEIRRQLRDVLRSTDVQAIKDVLARATIYKVRSELAGTLEKRVEWLELQTSHIKQLRKCLQETDVLVLGEATAALRRDGLDNPGRWELPEGAKLLSKVISRKLMLQRTEQIDAAIRRACRVYDVQALEQRFREAEQLGILTDHFVEAKQLLLSLHDGDQISRFITDLREELKMPSAEDARVTQAIKNLVDQQRHLGLAGDTEALRDVSAAMARTRARSRGKSCIDALNFEEAEVARSVFEDLRNLKCLRDPLSWDTDSVDLDVEARARAMLEFQTDKITSSLTVLSVRQEMIAVQNFQDVLRCMGDKPCAFTGNKEEPILRRLALSRRVCDESYVQVLKQLTNNPSYESRAKGWQLLKRMVTTVLPSAEVYEFLRVFVQVETEPEKKQELAEKRDFRRLAAMAARRFQEEHPEAEEGHGGIAAVARAAARMQMSQSRRTSVAEEEAGVSPAPTEASTRRTRSVRSRRSTRRTSLAAALEAREREEERMERRKTRCERQVAMALEILGILTQE